MTDDRRHRRPAPFVLEGMAVAELGAYAALRPLLARAPRGDGHRVLVLPGLMAGDPSTVPLRSLLRQWGYQAHGWGLGRNLGPTDAVLDGLRRRVGDLLARDGGRPISIVGWSLGGIYAREIARRLPDRIRTVVTLGSPFRLAERGRSNVAGVYRSMAPLHSTRVAGLRDDDDARRAFAALPPPGTATTAVWTATDGVVPPASCREAPGDRCESIEVRGSHSGLGHNPAALLVIADRLAAAPDDWRPFRPPWWARAWYPSP